MLKKGLVFGLAFICLQTQAQDSTVKRVYPTQVFLSQKLINAKTVETIRKGWLDFSVTHNFGDIGGSAGGVENFFGLDNAADIRIAFQYGLSKKTNLVFSRSKGAGAVNQLYELGLKHQFVNQGGEKNHPFSITAYGNIVASAEKVSGSVNAENQYADFSDRLSQMIQLMIARKMRGISLQLSPTYLHTNYTPAGEQKSLFAIGGAARIPLSKKFVFITDYFHPFRSKESEMVINATQGLDQFDALGVGFEIVTPGHVFNLNFTNATNILENRFLQRTYTSWGKGEWRWGFTISRSFIVKRGG
ncbi:MAG: DUF5777 family beta-barrel protein [Chitinophagaceae bacterium]|nr:DUF5777 family beta-barrel protein [Chitinophagaceae bacterium]